MPVFQFNPSQPNGRLEIGDLLYGAGAFVELPNSFGCPELTQVADGTPLSDPISTNDEFPSTPDNPAGSPDVGVALDDLSLDPTQVDEDQPDDTDPDDGEGDQAKGRKGR